MSDFVTLVDVEGNSVNDEANDAVRVSIVAASAGVTDTELPAARLLADALALPTAPDVIAATMVYNGATLDRVKGANASGDAVDGAGAVQTAPRLWNGTNYDRAKAANASGDNVDGAGALQAAPRLWNGATYDREYGNREAVLLASGARTATTNSPDQTNYNGRGVHVSIDVTVEGPATLAIKIQGKHSIGGTYYDIVDFGTVYTAATDAPGPKTVSLYPGILTADHVGVGAGVTGTIGKSAVLPRTWRAVVTHADATTCTYSLSAVTIN